MRFLRKIKIGKNVIGEGAPCFVIAEVGSNHNRNLKTAKKLIEVARDAGVDAVKFQTYSAETLYSKYTPRISEMEGRSKKGETPYELIKRIEIPRRWHKILSTYSKEKGILFFSTPFDTKAVDELDALGVPLFKIASYDLTNIPFLEYIAKKQKPIIMSTGTADLEEIEESLNVIYATGNKSVILLQCTSNYPTRLEEVNLRCINTLKDKFETIVGFSDHTTSNYAALAAVALGAKVIEKHITLDKTQKGPDHPFAIEPDKLRGLVEGIRAIEKALGSPHKKTLNSEKENKMLARRSIHAKVKIPKNTIIKEEMIIIKRPALGIEPKFLNKVFGRRALVDIEEDTWISWDKLSKD